MKLATTILAMLIIQTSASFFDEFRGAVSSVENSFERLLSDVVTDVKDTISCTILAVRQVLSLGGNFEGSSYYDDRCRGEIVDNERAPTVDDKDVSFVITPQFDYSFPTNEFSRNREEFIREMSLEIDESIANVNNILYSILSSRNDYRKLGKIENVLENETNSLIDVSESLRKELDVISKKVKSEINKLDTAQIEPSAENIWHDIKILREIEHNDKNKTEANEIHHVLDEILDVLHKKESTSDTKADDKKMNEIINDLEKETNHKPTDVVETPTIRTDDFPSTFKDVAKKIMDESNAERNSDEKFNLFSTDNLLPKNVDTPIVEPVTTEKPQTEATDPLDYNSLFQFAPKQGETPKEDVKQAEKLIEDSKYTQMIMDSLNNDNAASNVFDNPDLLNFG